MLHSNAVNGGFFFWLETRIRQANQSPDGVSRAGDISVFIDARLGNRRIRRKSVEECGRCGGQVAFGIKQDTKRECLVRRTIWCLNNKNSRLVDIGAVPGGKSLTGEPPAPVAHGSAAA